MKYTRGHTPHNKGKSACPHGVGNMSKCGICRAAKDAAHYLRVKAQRVKYARKREQWRRAEQRRNADPAWRAARLAQKRAWNKRPMPESPPLDPLLSTYLYGAAK